MTVIYIAYVMLFEKNYTNIALLQTLFIISAILDINWFFFGLEEFKKTITRNTILKGGKDYFSPLKETFQNDKMIDFEQGIAYDCLKDYDNAICIYEQVSFEIGLPVKHWRDVAAFFLELAKMKKHHCAMPDTLEEKLKMGSSAQSEDYRRQWNAFFLSSQFCKASRTH